MRTRKRTKAGVRMPHARPAKTGWCFSGEDLGPEEFCTLAPPRVWRAGKALAGEPRPN